MQVHQGGLAHCMTGHGEQEGLLPLTFACSWAASVYLVYWKRMLSSECRFDAGLHSPGHRFIYQT